MTHLKVGDKAPEFNSINQNSEPISSESLKGTKYIIFFYPKDNTPGCTAEACSIRDHYKKLQKAGYKIFGVSPDSAKKHQNFIGKFDLQYDLLADTEKEMLKAYGAWGEKSFMGKKYIGVHRSTFVIDENGQLSHIYSKVKTKTHGQDLLDDLT